MDTNNGNANRSKIRTYYIIMFFLKSGLGIGLIICGTQGVRYTKGQEDTFGPPYYIGGFAAGSCLIIAGLAAGVNWKIFNQDDPDQNSTRKTILTEIAFTVLAGFSCFFGIFFVSAFGLKGCDNGGHGCNYYENISQNQTLATIILVGLLLTLAILVISIYNVCCSQLLAAYKVNNRGRFRRNVQHAPTNITYNYTVGGQAGNQPQYHYPVATCGVTGTQSGSGYPGGQSADNQIRDLEEQNRLLREQLELQAQLNQQQQPQPYPSQNFPAPPPPSYSDCVSNPEKADIGVSGDVAPSAPPL